MIMQIKVNKFRVAWKLCQNHSLSSIRNTRNHGNSLSRFFDKNFVKATVLQKKLLKSWFHEIFFSARENFSIFHTVISVLYFIFQSMVTISDQSCIKSALIKRPALLESFQIFTLWHTIAVMDEWMLFMLLPFVIVV